MNWVGLPFFCLLMFFNKEIKMNKTLYPNHMFCYMFHQEPKRDFFLLHLHSTVSHLLSTNRRWRETISYTKLLVHVNSICHEYLALLSRYWRSNIISLKQRNFILKKNSQNLLVRMPAMICCCCCSRGIPLAEDYFNRITHFERQANKKGESVHSSRSLGHFSLPQGPF